VVEVTYDILDTNNDAYAKRQDTTGAYPITDTDTLIASQNAALEAASRNYVSSTTTMVVGVLLFRWNTATLPDSSAWPASPFLYKAELEYYSAGDTNANSINIIADWYDFGGGVVVADDWTAIITNPNACIGHPLVTRGVGSYRIPLINAQQNINRSGYTGLRIGISQRANDVAPTGVNRIQSLMHGFNTTTYPSGHVPRLVITYGTTGESLYPDGVTFVKTNLTGAATDVDEDPDSPDANWLTV
jgi:hypothetical protein